MVWWAQLWSSGPGAGLVTTPLTSLPLRLPQLDTNMLRRRFYQAFKTVFGEEVSVQFDLLEILFLLEFTVYSGGNIFFF